jgi:hypothetical protein
VAGLASQAGHSPLYVASRSGHSEVVDRLIAARAMVDAADKVLPRTRFHHPCSMNPHTLPLTWPLITFRCLSFSQTRRTPLHVAAFHGRASVVAALLAAGADSETRDVSGQERDRGRNRDIWGGEGNRDQLLASGRGGGSDDSDA